MKLCSKGVTAQWSCDCKLQKTRTEAWLDVRHRRKCASTNNVAYVDPNMKSIFEFNNMRFSTEMFCHISVIKDDSCVVAYGCFFLPEHLQVSGGANRKSSTLFTADAATMLVWMRSFAGIFHISFSPLTNLSILMLSFSELMAADDYLNWILPKCVLVFVKCVTLFTWVHRSAHVWK